MPQPTRILLTLLLLGSAGPALAGDDNLMKQLDVDVFETDAGGDAPDWEIPPAGVDVDDEAVDAEPDADLDPAPVDSLDDDPPGDMALIAGPSEDPPEDLRPSKPPPAKAPTGGAVAGPLDTSGKTPLKDNFDARVVSKDIDAVVVELPVLVARSATTWSGGDYWLVAEFSVAGSKVGEARHLVTKAAIADLAPTVAFLKAQVPVVANSGAVEVKVSQLVDGTSAKQLFSRKVDYRL